MPRRAAPEEGGGRADVVARLRAAIGSRRGPFAVALSGGMDSTVLLHALHALHRQVRALHVDHRLQPASSAWASRCVAECESLGVACSVLTVTVGARAGRGIEAAAREARYEALRRALQPGEWLLTAHHADDQAETVLLNLLRGAGAAGLAGVAARMPFGAGQLLRPLLGVPRGALLDYARRHRLAWTDDPMNEDEALGRNFLRRRVLPVLEERWPGARETLARGADLAAESAGLLDEVAAADARRVWRRRCVELRALGRLGEARQRNLLRHLCLRELGSAPPLVRLRTGLAQLTGAARDRQPLLAWPGGEIRRYRDCLYLARPLGAAGTGAASLELRAGAAAAVGAGGRLRVVRTRADRAALDPARLPATLAIRMRTGGERLRLPGSRIHRPLAKLFQERGVLPWMRDRLPLLYAGEELVAVADLWVAAAYAAGPGKPGLGLRWQDAPACVGHRGKH